MLTAGLEPTWVLTAAMGNDTLVAYEAPERDEWRYEAALSAAHSALLSTRPEPAVAA
jgi:hypothetical protein